jgi:hypothetical protein
MIPTHQKTRLSLDSLAGMRSVRTTFRLSQRADEALSQLRKTSKVTAKAMLDVLTTAFLQTSLFTDLSMETAGAKTGDEGSRIRKTWVISKTALTLINSTAKTKGISRDRLVESMILLYQAIIEQSRKPEKCKEALKMVKDLWNQADTVKSTLWDIWDTDDKELNGILDTLDWALDTLRGLIETRIEQDFPAEPESL